jgi:hypothetical protein
VVVPGCAIGFETVEELNPVDGVQLYVLPACAVVPIMTLSLAQAVTSAPAFTPGIGLILTVTVSVSVQPVDVFVMVNTYIVVVPGLAEGCAAVAELNPVAGDQL